MYGKIDDTFINYSFLVAYEAIKPVSIVVAFVPCQVYSILIEYKKCGYTMVATASLNAWNSTTEKANLSKKILRDANFN